MSFQQDVDNLVFTYRSLVEAVPNSSVHSIDGGILASGPIRHPICNFALVTSLDDQKISSLADLDCGNWFHLYYVSEDSVRPEICGFQPAYHLTLMSAPAVPNQAYENLTKAENSERKEVARFMANQFFGRSGQSTMELVSSATASGCGLDLYGIKSTGLISRLFIAAMLTQTEGVTGLYNLCVDNSQRGKGHGKKMVERIIAQASVRQKRTVLQCDSSLVNWYETLGFEPVGTLHAWYLSEKGL